VTKLADSRIFEKALSISWNYGRLKEYFLAENRLLCSASKCLIVDMEYRGLILRKYATG